MGKQIENNPTLGNLALIAMIIYLAIDAYLTSLLFIMKSEGLESMLKGAGFFVFLFILGYGLISLFGVLGKFGLVLLSVGLLLALWGMVRLT